MKKHYYTKLHVTEFKGERRYEGSESTCAHFYTNDKIKSEDWENARAEAIELFGNQAVAYGWKGYIIGKTYMETHREAVTCMSPAYFEGHRSKPVFKEV